MYTIAYASAVFRLFGIPSEAPATAARAPLSCLEFVAESASRTIPAFSFLESE
jgi:hypothetical protein